MNEMAGRVLPPGHGPVLTLRGQELVLWCECQRAGRGRAMRGCRPVGSRVRWQVPEVVFALLAWHRDAPGRQRE